MKIYTKTGDKGLTNLAGGRTVPKDAERIEAYGTIDELNSWVGYTISMLTDDFDEVEKELTKIQQLLFDAGTDLALPSEELDRLYRITTEAAQWLEQRIDYYTEQTPDIDRFIFPGGSSGAGMLHVSRTITRRAERTIVKLNRTAPVNSEVMVFINRLSDYFYALARALNKRSNVKDTFYECGNTVFCSRKNNGKEN